MVEDIIVKKGCIVVKDRVLLIYCTFQHGVRNYRYVNVGEIVVRWYDTGSRIGTETDDVGQLMIQKLKY
jgi:hypothetical protein